MDKIFQSAERKLLETADPMPTPSSRNYIPVPVGSSIWSRPRTVASGNRSRPRTSTGTVVLNIQQGLDIVQSVVEYAGRNSLNLTVVFGTGLVSEAVTCCAGSDVQPAQVPGIFRIISFSGTCMGSNAAAAAAAAARSASYEHIARCFTVSAVDAEGAFVGGLVTSMKAAGPVMLLVSKTDAPSSMYSGPSRLYGH